MISKFTLGLALTATALILGSCDRTCVCHLGKNDFASARVEAQIDWSCLETKPSGMTAIWHDLALDRLDINLTNDVENIHKDLKPGNYNLLVFNHTQQELDHLSFINMENPNVAKVVGVADHNSSWNDVAGNVILNPDKLSVGEIEDIRVTESMCASICKCHDCECCLLHEGKIHNLGIVRPTPLIYDFKIHIEAEGLDNLKSMDALITGMANGVYLNNGTRTDGLASQEIKNWKLHKSEGKLSAAINSFGLSESDTPQSLHLRMLLVDGKTIVEYRINVSNLIVEDDESKVLTLNVILDEPLPDVKPESGSGGFGASVDEWDEENIIEIEMG